MFSKESSNTISLAMVTPSLQTKGAPNALSSITLRPLGPNVTLTVSASLSAPRFRACLASSEYVSCLAILLSFHSAVFWSGDFCQYIAFS